MYQLRPDKNQEHGQSAEAALDGDQSYFVNIVDDLAVRLIGLNDVSRAIREEWLTEVFTHVESFPFDDDDTRCVSLAFDDYDALVLSGNDATRMIRFIRINRKIVGRKIKLCVMSESQPRRRAALLAAGFDDVFDTSRQDQQEAIARIRSIQSRYKAMRDQEAKASDRQGRLAALVEPHQLTPREADVLTLLLESPGYFAKYSTLISRLSTPKRMISMDNLKVSVSKIRLKLRQGTTLQAHHKAGYKLTLGDQPARTGRTSGEGGRSSKRTSATAQAAPAPQRLPEGFILHDGNSCPVDQDSKPGVILRRGDRFDVGEVTAGSWDWEHLGDGSDVLGYRPEIRKS